MGIPGGAVVIFCFFFFFNKKSSLSSQSIFVGFDKYCVYKRGILVFASPEFCKAVMRDMQQQTTIFN